MKKSAGTLLYRHGEQGLEVLLVHPSGNYNRKAPWSIPKGEPEGAEDLEVTARRETLEETGLTATHLTSLEHIFYQKSRKQVFAFAGPAPVDVEPRLASWEIDQAKFFRVQEARLRIHPDQAVFLDRLLQHLHMPAT